MYADFGKDKKIPTQNLLQNDAVADYEKVELNLLKDALVHKR